ncbi:hypothetical protein BDP81DRAFT_392932 [Colletotrichum phormii]|uniref:mRNA splicing factor RNA helicase n=1 Tax=Colletotrichum phormii TaxID=359342 RepID=A0AAI9ZWM8_9PEZI|nr:uncharacterized protein BDP81DRAFT_392932 [Colletotrichum phormii]KAK1638328.1 hypothetical protein BDP81DRAFT_392932 [Colletotrichum phormii]
MASPADESPTTDAAPAPAPIMFRANKKRKAGLRQRAASPTEDNDNNTVSKPNSIAENATTPASITETTSTGDDGPESHIPSALRHRARKRLNGVGFSARGSFSATITTNTAAGDDTDPMSLSSSRALVPAPAQTPDDDPLIAKRFAPQTGAAATTIVNKHMMEYIESHLSNRNPPPPPSSEQSTSQYQAAATNPSTTTASASTETPDPKNHPIMQGKLMEVDLGDEVRARNQAMTEKAARRLLGEAVDDDGSGNGGRRAKKPRLGRDGKPWRPRNRRNSDDVKRDQLVEEILRENRLDVYDVPKPQEPQNDGDGDADDRIAEEFRREFMDAMVQRQQKKKTAAPAARAGARKADEEVLKGPKLGGSRNARAAMRDLLLKKEKEKDSRR